MAATVRFLISSSSASARNLNQLLQPLPHHSPMLSQFLRNLYHSFSPFSSNFGPSYSRGMASSSNYLLNEFGTCNSLTLDDRVPATVITGFLGSGKVAFFFSLYYILFLFDYVDNMVKMIGNVDFF